MLARTLIALNSRRFQLAGFTAGLTDCMRNHSFAQLFLPQGIKFTTQAQIDSFPDNHPNCSEIQGLVYIIGSNIANLTGLSFIFSVGADLYIRNAPALTNLSGLDNLILVGNEVSIGGNAARNSLMGLDNIDANSIMDLTLVDNDSHSACEMLSVCSYLSNPNRNVVVQVRVISLIPDAVDRVVHRGFDDVEADRQGGDQHDEQQGQQE